VRNARANAEMKVHGQSGHFRFGRSQHSKMGAGFDFTCPDKLWSVKPERKVDCNRPMRCWLGVGSLHHFMKRRGWSMRLWFDSSARHANVRSRRHRGGGTRTAPLRLSGAARGICLNRIWLIRSSEAKKGCAREHRDLCLENLEASVRSAA